VRSAGSSPGPQPIGVEAAESPITGTGFSRSSAGPAAGSPGAWPTIDRTAPGDSPPLGELVAGGSPLRWSDVIAGWPDDVDLEPVSGPPVSVAGPPAPAPTELGDLMDIEEPFLSPAGEADTTGLASAAAAGRRPLPPPEWVRPESGAEPFSLPKPRPPAPWPVASGPDGDQDALGGYEWTRAQELRSAGSAGDEGEPAPLSGAGAFGGDPARSGRRIGLRAFDPGKRGVKALAAVAAVVVALAAVLAWRARPRIDAVAPPAFGAAGSSAGPDGGGGGVQASVPAATARDGASSAAEVVVAVGGKVRKPGLVRLPPGARVADALTAAGGADPGVDVAMLNLARKVVDGELILVGVTPSPGVALGTGPAVASTGGAAAGGPVNLNTATLADLDGLPGVGPVLAQRILDARDAQGGFRSVGDLRKVNGIGDARYEQLKDLVTV
jgi:competence protein ComEA